MIRIALDNKNEKWCPKCKSIKKRIEFRKAGYRKEGVHSWCRPCERKYLNDRKHLYKENKNKQAKIFHAKLRLETLQAYSRAVIPYCICCAEHLLEFLSIDHINGGGNKEKALHRGNFYNWLKKKGFPPGYRVLCHNCNQALGAYGYCPHGTLEHRAATCS